MVIRDNTPAHGGNAARDRLATPDLALRVARLPAYGPGCNANEAIRAGRARKHHGRSLAPGRSGRSRQH